MSMKARMKVSGSAADHRWAAGEEIEADYRIVAQLLAVGLAEPLNDAAAAFAPGGAMHAKAMQNNPFIASAREYAESQKQGE